MGIMEQFGRKLYAPGKGVTEPPPQKGPKRFFFLLLTHFWKLITLNLLFLLFCIPVVTIPAALCSLNRVLLLLVREGNSFVWSDFIKEFKASFLKSLPFGILYVFLLVDCYCLVYLKNIIGEGFMGDAAVVGAVCLLGFTVLFSSYVFVLLPILDLKNRQIAKNSLILMLVEWKTSLIILASTSVMVFFAAALFPYSIIAVILIWFSFLQLIICTAVNEPVQRRIVEPFEQKSAGEVT